ncbi:MAG: SdpI family protein [Anaerolineae bacterium]|nr:SdpI family protein [Anaerolineae bacterium]
MSTKNTLIVVVILILFTVLLSMTVSSYLPDRIPSHWDANGNINGYQSKTEFIWIMPGMMLFLSILMIFLPQIDPKKANFLPTRNAYHLLVIGMVVFLFALQIYMILQALGYKFNMVLWMIPLYAALMAGIGFLLERARMNWFVGIRTPWTLSNPVVWEKTHRMGGWLFKICGIVILLGLFFIPIAFWFIIVPTVGTALFLVVYSYIIFQQEQKKI